MRVDGQRVGGLDAGKRAAQSVRSDQGATPGGIDMDTKADSDARFPQRSDSGSIMPALVVPAVAAIMTGTSPPPNRRKSSPASAAGFMRPDTIGRDQPHRVAADPA